MVITNASGSVTSSVASLSISNVNSAIWKNLVAYYPFNGNAEDASGNGNNGTVYGATLSTNYLGSQSNAYFFDGSSYIQIPNSASLYQPTKSLTISVWVNQTDWSQSGQNFYCAVIGKRTTADFNALTPEWGLSFARFPGLGYSEIGSVDGAISSLPYDHFNTVFMNRWTQFAVVYDLPQVTFFTNGVKWATSDAGISAFRRNDQGVEIGRNAGGYVSYCKGLLDDIRIYNRALSPNEVAQLYVSEAPALPTITQQPVAQVVNLGDVVTFEVRATNTVAPTYQWQKDGLTLPGATGSALTFTNVQPPRIGDYTVVVGNSSGSVTSSVASLSISNVNSALWKNLLAYYPFDGNAKDGSGNENNGNATNVRFRSNRFAQAGSAADFSSGDAFVECPTISGMPYFPVTYSVWFKLDSFPLPSELNPGYGGYGAMTLLGREVPNYFYGGALCLYHEGGAGITNEIIYYTGDTALRTYRTPETNRWTHLVFTFDPSKVATFYMDGQLVHSEICTTLQNAVMPFRVGASGSLTSGRFGWRGAIDDVRVYNRALSPEEIAQLYTSEAPNPPIITQQPVGRVVNQGDWVSFEVGVTSSSGSPAYQWRKNGVDLIGATSSILTLSSVQPSDAGNYTVVVGAGGPTVTSAVARLDVIHRATATPIVNFGFVVGGTVLGGGFGYTNTPLVHIVGGGGSGAVATAIVSNGVVTGIRMLNAGFDYTSTPLMIIQPPFIPNPSLAVSPMTELTSAELAQGGNYQLQRKMVWFWTNEMPSFQATSSSITQLVAGIAGTATYRLVLSPTPSQAFATPEMVHGFVVGVTINAGGSGYVTTPRVVIYGGGGTNATAVASLTGGVVTGIAITSAGIGYTSAPSIRIDPPPAASVTPQQTQVLRLKSANLSPYDTYRFEATPAVGSPWQAIGSPVVPTKSTNTTDVTVTNSAGFLRLKYVP